MFRSQRARSDAPSRVRASMSIRPKSFISSSVVPISTATSRERPSWIAAKGSRGMTSPSTTGTKESPSRLRSCGLGTAPGDPANLGETARWASRSRAGGSSRRRSAVPAVSPRSPRNASETLSASSRGATKFADPLCRIARRKSPRARGMPRRVATLIAPADSPKTVTFAGSPPKAAISSRTHSSAAIWSRIPSFPVAGSRSPQSVFR